MKRVMPAVMAAVILCLLLPLGFFYTASRPPAIKPDTGIATESIRPVSIFDGMEVFTDGRWFLLPDGRLADIADGRVYMTDLDFAPFERIEINGDRLLADDEPIHIYQAKVYPRLGILNSEYEMLKARFPDAIIAALSNFHLVAVIGGQLYTFTDEGNLSVVRVGWELHGDEKSLFEQICLFYEYPDEFARTDRYYVFDGGMLRCFNTMFGELDIF
jgi:hypothetical protein